MHRQFIDKKKCSISEEIFRRKGKLKQGNTNLKKMR